MNDHALTTLLDALLEALEGRRRRPLRLGWLVKVGTIGVRVTPHEGTQLMFMLPVDKKAIIAPIIQDKAGNPARVDGVPSWSVSDEGFGTLTVAPDGMSAEYLPSGTLGSMQVNLEADADLGEGVKPLKGALDVQIEAGEAAVIVLNATVVPVD